NWRLSDYNLKPVGSGPYKFDTYNKESTGFINEYRLKPNRAHVNAAPYIETVRFAFFPDGNSLIEAFNKGAIDGITSPDLSTIANVKRSYREYAFRIPSYYAVFMNQSQSVPLQDAVVRRALELSVDRDHLVKDVFDGHALPAYGPIPASSGFSTATSSAPSLDRAAQMLDNAGWKADSDGIRKKTVKGGSIRLELTLTVPEIPFFTKTADDLKDAWQKLGAQVTVNPLPAGDTMTETINTRGYQMLLFGNVLNPDFDLYPFWNSKERFSPGLNLALYSNKTVDTLTSDIEQEQNKDVRIDKLHQAERAIVSDNPAVFLYSPEYIYLASKEVRGIEPHLIAEPSDRFLDLPLWYVKTMRAVAK
ncbi:MAG: ABC transporter substrate-binding protein, partial [Candidatus Liptonbacteria bacterium]